MGLTSKMKHSFSRNVCSNVRFIVSSLVYNIHDTIEGRVLFTPQQEIRPDQLQLSFLGTTIVQNDKIATNVYDKETCSQTFLRIQQPLYKESWLYLDHLQIGTEYELRFEFVVPAELSHNVCPHPHSHAQVHDHHVQLPPSLGRQRMFPDDMTPDAVSIDYRLQLTVTSDKAQKWSHPVHIISSREELPPILPPDRSRYYCLAQTKHLNGVLRKRAGFLSAQAIQPSAIHIHSPKQSTKSTTITINLEYIGTGKPPDLQSLSTSLRAMTFFGSESWTDYPDLVEYSTWSPKQNWYKHSAALHAPKIQLKWQFGKDAKGWDVYTASVDVPVTLPESVSYPPTFLSCLVARVYTVKVVIHHGSEGWSKSPISLKIPLQIC